MLMARSIAFILAALLWLGSARFLFTLDARELGASLVNEQLALVASAELDAQRADMRTVNPEWDFMGRTFAVLAFANRALAEPAAADQYLVAMDALIERTLREEREHGTTHFLLPYAEVGTFRDPTGRSLFVDGEIALMIGARQSVLRDARFDRALAERVEQIEAQLRAGPLVSGESYPDECWIFDNTAALAALRIFDVIYGTDHNALFLAWLEIARTKLTDPETGLLVSSFSYDGLHLNGPEGSTLWTAAHNLLLIDPELAHAQYAIAKRHLARTALGFGWAREWAHAVQPMDIDSGAVLPGIELSAASSGLAFVGARAFNDEAYEQSLLRSLALGGFPSATETGLRFATTNQVADSVIAYGLVQGPLWRKIGPAFRSVRRRPGS